jgi:hypothetical protein
LVNYWDFKNPTPFNSSIVKIKYLKQLEKIKNHLSKAFDKLIITAQGKKIEKTIIDELRSNKNKINMSEVSQEIFDVLKTTFLLMNQNSL